jgi:hypothetical protein
LAKGFILAPAFNPLANELGPPDNRRPMTYPKLAHTKTRFIFSDGKELIGDVITSSYESPWLLLRHEGANGEQLESMINLDYVRMLNVVKS